jgi:ribose transport system permease protein
MTDGASVVGAKRSFPSVLDVVERYGPLIFLAGIWVFFAAKKTETFPTWDNLLLVLSTAALPGIVASGLTMTLIVGEFDLSIGFVFALGGVMATNWMDSIGVVPSVLVALATGIVFGLGNGSIVAFIGISAFIGTLGTGAIAQGIVQWITGGSAKAGFPQGFLRISSDDTLGIPNEIWIMFGVMGLLWLLLTRTEAGRRIDAIGGNREAAKLAGIRISRYILLVFAISATCAAFAGMLAASELDSAYANAGTRTCSMRSPRASSARRCSSPASSRSPGRWSA